MVTWITNGKVVDGHTVTARDVWMEDGRICAPRLKADRVVDAQGAYILPGFIDIHTHGAANVYFGNIQDFADAMAYFGSHGVTTVLPTLGTHPVEKLKGHIAHILSEQEKAHPGAAIGGIHLEGPFISQAKKGAMLPMEIACNVENFDALIDAGQGQVRVMTIAPERENACQVISRGVERGVRMSIGHTDATYEEACAAVNAGASGATHTFNAMRAYNHREPGVLGAVLTDPRVVCEAIGDMVHTAPATFRLIHACKGNDGMILVSDCNAAAGMGDGEYLLDGRVRYVKDGVSRLANGTISCSTCTVYDDAKKLLSLGFSLCDIVALAAENPAAAIGLDDRIGAVSIGKDADLFLCDDALNIHQVYIKGERYV